MAGRVAAGDDVLDRFGDWIGSFRRHSKAALIVHSLEAPADCGRAAYWTRSGWTMRRKRVQRINRGLRAIAGEYRGVYILDYDALVARHGRESWGDARSG